MAKELSPKKYIEASARKLPIYKCYVNRDWATAKLADVFIMRKHSNGNITAAVYLVDLACLGIKDTLFFFNQPETSINERLSIPNPMLEEIDYNLAHNIVFAAHDYALDYDINPHIGFATTKFLLEEDSDNIPLIDIPVGGPDGNPHLLLHPGQFIKFKHVYDKLVKNLGKDNFTYTIGMEEPDEHELYDDVDEIEDNKDEEDLAHIDDFDPGAITRSDAKEIDIYDLIDNDKVSKRLPHEVISLEIELILRLLSIKRIHLFYSEDELDEKVEYILYKNAKKYPLWMNPEMLEEFKEMMNHDIKAFQEYQTNTRTEEDLMIFDNNQTITHLHKYQHNPYLIHLLFEKSVLRGNLDTINILREHITQLANQYVSAKLELALCTYFLDDPAPEINDIIEGTDLQKLFPDVEEFSDMELNLFSILKLLISIRNNNLKEAIYYYNFLSDIDIITPLLTMMQVQFQQFITEPGMEAYNEIEKETSKEQN